MSLSLRSKFRLRLIIFNILAEFFGSTIYSLLFFIFISRHISENFEFSYVALSWAIGLSFFAAIYIPLHTYRIHIIPFVTIINAIRKKQPRLLWHKIPAQIAGALSGVLIFLLVTEKAHPVNIADMATIHIPDPYFLALINALVLGVYCYLFYIIRVFFKSRKINGTIFLGGIVSILFFLTGKIAGISALNPFGLLFYDLITGSETVISHSWQMQQFVHILAPLLMSFIIYYHIKNFYRRIDVKPVVKQHNPVMKNYDI